MAIIEITQIGNLPAGWESDKGITGTKCTMSITGFLDYVG